VKSEEFAAALVSPLD